jgi:solute carrier family 25 oxoglutarate transporter 11
MAAAQTSEPPAAWKAVKPFVNGGMSGMAATCIIQPIDMVKVRIQLGATGSPVSLRARLDAAMVQLRNAAAEP